MISVQFPVTPPSDPFLDLGGAIPEKSSDLSRSVLVESVVRVLDLQNEPHNNLLTPPEPRRLEYPGQVPPYSLIADEPYGHGKRAVGGDQTLPSPALSSTLNPETMRLAPGPQHATVPR